MRLGPGLYAASPTTTEADVVEALCRMHPGAIACGITAARLWGLPLPRRHQRWEPGMPVHLTAERFRRSTPQVTWHLLSLRPDDVIVGERIRSTSAERTFVDVAPLLSHEDAVALGDALVRIPRERFEGRDLPWTTPDRLRRRIDAPRVRHRDVLLERVADVRVGADSPPETFLRLAAVRVGLPEPVPNRRLVVDGVDLGDPDLQWPGYRVCAEHEGPHHLTPEQLERDIRRSELRRRMGWIEVRTTAADLRDGCARAVQRYRQALVEQGWRG